jgi:hypothetical protein
MDSFLHCSGSPLSGTIVLFHKGNCDDTTSHGKMQALFANLQIYVRSSIKLQGSNEPSQLIFLPRRTLKMKKMTIRKMLERIVVATNKRRAKNIVLVSTDGEIVEAEFAVDLIRTLTDWNILWEVTVISEKFYEDRFVVIFDPNIKQVNGDPDKGDTWL